MSTHVRSVRSVGPSSSAKNSSTDQIVNNLSQSFIENTTESTSPSFGETSTFQVSSDEPSDWPIAVNETPGTFEPKEVDIFVLSASPSFTTTNRPAPVITTPSQISFPPPISSYSNKTHKIAQGGNSKGLELGGGQSLNSRYNVQDNSDPEYMGKGREFVDDISSASHMPVWSVLFVLMVSGGVCVLIFYCCLHKWWKRWRPSGGIGDKGKGLIPGKVDLKSVQLLGQTYKEKVNSKSIH